MSSLTIGLVIPCYKGHIGYLKRLFDSIEAQTRKPDQVVVSCSSALPEDIPYRQEMYSFPFTIHTHAEKKNVAQNRNSGARLLTTDLITFFDADDEMHPQRLEYIVDAFTKNDIKIFLHNSTENVAAPFTRYDSAEYHRNCLNRCQWGATVMTFWLPNRLIHNGQPTVRREIFAEIPFKEGVEYQTKDDTVFCTDVIVAYPQHTMYCHNVLSKYYPSRTGGCNA
jgi:glycosyltransferase involved in cell wall biosynthesis